ncbi:hypothetical protein [Gordonia malaquae]|uniref:hypothetical protein n=1 Tax=Gordonia malaquae TaxID=410332 RepID=UPI003019DA2C
MTIPTFGSSTTLAQPETITRHAAAVQLGITHKSLSMLITAGILTEPLLRADVDALAARDRLVGRSGELTVLRIGALTPASDPGRQFIGFAADIDDQQLADATLGMWRANPERVIGNRLYAVAMRTIPVALFAITGCPNIDAPLVDDSGKLRYRFDGELLARIEPAAGRPGQPTSTAENTIDGHGVVPSSFWVRSTVDASSPYRAAVEAIMTSRIAVDSGGPVGYLSGPA